MNEVSRILSAMTQGNTQASDQLFPLVYEELRKLAARCLAQESPGQTLQPTALVHEAYMRLTEVEGREPVWDNRRHFFAAAAEAMRRILVDNARRKSRLKRGGDWNRVSVENLDSLVEDPGEELLGLDEALNRLAAHDPLKGQVVKLRFFAGLKMWEVARSLNMSLATAERYWTFARAWLYAELTRMNQK